MKNLYNLCDLHIDNSTCATVFLYCIFILSIIIIRKRRDEGREREKLVFIAFILIYHFNISIYKLFICSIKDTYAFT